jgi:hypothetical protein
MPNPGEPGHALLAQLAHGLVRHGEDQTRRSLGDRRDYVGMSDVGKAIDCLRAAVANKVVPHPPADPAAAYRQGDAVAVDAILRRELTLHRGHWFEAGIEAAFHANRTPLLPQVEIAMNDHGVPIRAHLDFVLLRGGPKPAVRVLELKSMTRIPAALYPAHEAQLYGQIGLIAKQWAKPAFSLRDEAGGVRFANVGFPDLVRRSLGIDLPDESRHVDLQGWVLAVSMTEAKPFGPYLPDPTMLSLCRKTAKTIWQTAAEVRSGATHLDTVAICPGFHPLCDCCPFVEDCPKFRGLCVADPALDRDLDELAGLKGQRLALDTEIDEREERIRRFCHLSSDSAQWLDTGFYRFRNARVPGRRTVDSNKLRSALETHLDDPTIDAVLAASTNIGADYERLSISPVKQSQTLSA